MVKKMVQKGLFLAAFIGLQSLPAYAGAVRQLHKINLPGKTVIICGETHKGDVEDTPYTVQYVAQQQGPAFESLFRDFATQRNNVAFYIECNDSMKKTLKSAQKRNPGRIFDNPPSYFDQFYSQYVHNQATPVAETLSNFDSRQTMDLCLLFLGNEFDTFLKGYKDSGYSSVYFDKARQDFFETDEYQFFIEQFQGWKDVVVTRLENAQQNFAQRLSPKDLNSIKNLIDVRTKDFAAAIILNDKAAFIKKNIFEFLFDLAQMYKDDFFNILKSDHFFASENIESVWSLFRVFSIFADLTLIEKILQDPHPFVLVHCGFEHSEHIMEYFFQEYTSNTNLLDLLKEEYLNDANHCYQAMRQFIHSK